MNLDKNEYPYWMALAHLPRMRTKRKHEIIDLFTHENRSIIDFFSLDETEWKKKFVLTDKELSLLRKAKDQLANYSFIIEDFLEQGYNIISFNSKEYPTTLKKNLANNAPLILYTKGDQQLLKHPATAIVGSRKASKTSIEFVDNIVKKEVEKGNIIVSGFAKGVDRASLDCSLKYNGKSIIVLPQGITTFTLGFKKYYKKIIQSQILVLSTFYPKSPWSVQFAMARNRIIYGLANQIYVAESSKKGGTWSGVIDGLRKDWAIYVRKANTLENNANNLLIQKGAIPVDMIGQIIKQGNKQIETKESMDARIIELLSKKPYSSKEIISKLKLEISPRKLTNYLKKNPNINTLKDTSPIKFITKNKPSQRTLF